MEVSGQLHTISAVPQGKSPQYSLDRRVDELKRNEVAREWRKLHTEELHNLYTSPDIIRAIKSRMMR
jgi:hypothetical protein